MTAPADDAALLPCPFCGGATAHMALPTCTKTTPYDPSDRAFPKIGCGGCYTEVPGNDWDQSGKSAIAAWNRRAPVPGYEAGRIAGLEEAAKIVELASLKITDFNIYALLRKLAVSIRTIRPAPPASVTPDSEE